MYDIKCGLQMQRYSCCYFWTLISTPKITKLKTWSHSDCKKKLYSLHPTESSCQQSFFFYYYPSSKFSDSQNFRELYSLRKVFLREGQGQWHHSQDCITKGGRCGMLFLIEHLKQALRGAGSSVQCSHALEHWSISKPLLENRKWKHPPSSPLCDRILEIMLLP